MLFKATYLLYWGALFGSSQIADAAKLTSFCITSYDTTSLSVVPTGTTSATTTTTRMITSTSTTTSTITPAPSTITKYVTSTVKTTTTLPKTTNTYTSTVTHSATTVSTSTTVVSVTSSTTSTVTNTSPVTVSATPGFTPLASVVAGSGYSADPNLCSTTATAVMKRRSMRDFLQPRAKPATGGGGGITINAAGVSPSQYPTQVECTSLFYATVTSTSVVSGPTSTVTARQQTIATTSTTTTTLTSTKLPSSVVLTTVDTTITVTSVTTQSTTSTYSATEITTTYQPTSTSYPTCDDNNIVSCVSGMSIEQFSYNGYLGIQGPTNARDCCIACTKLSSCGGSFFLYNQPPNQSCFAILTSGGKCNPRNAYGNFSVSQDGSLQASLSNSNCGQWTFLNQGPTAPMS